MSTEQTEMAALNTVRIIFDEAAGEYRFESKGKTVEFDFIPREIDIRNGIENRDPSYLISMGDELGKGFLPGTKPLTLHYSMPFVVFPKSFFANEENAMRLGVKADLSHDGKYTLLQGNNRFLGLEQLINYNLDLFRQAREAGTPEAIQSFYDNRVNFDDFSFQILPIEHLQNREYVLWLQIAVNDGVKTHSVSQNIKAALSFYNFLADQHQDWSKGELREAVARAFNVTAKRVDQFTTARNTFPEWMYGRIDDEQLSFDTAVKLVSAFNRQIVKGTGSTMTIEEFYNICWNDAVDAADATVEKVKITPTTLKNTLSLLVSEIGESDEVIDNGGVAEPNGESGEGASDSQDGDNQTDSGSDGKKASPYQDNTIGELVDLAGSRLGEVMDRIGNLDSMVTDMDDKNLIKLLSALDLFLTKTTIETADLPGNLITTSLRLQKEEAQAAAKEAKKKAGKVTVPSEDAAQPELAPV